MTKYSRVIVIGLDGFDAGVAEQMLAAGELPNLARLRAGGGYARLQTTYPASTPVAWSTFSTGVNPGAHGIFDFVGRDPKTYLPRLALNRYEQKNAFLPPRAVNLRRGIPLWDVLGQAGIESTVLRCPCTYPPDNVRGHMLAGVGVPDLRGGLGTPTFYTSAGAVSAQDSERIVHLSAGAEAADGRLRTILAGPRHPKTGEDMQLAVTLHLEPGAGRCTVECEGQPGRLTLKVGQWSDWLKVKFKQGMLQSVRGMVRFYLVRMTPTFELYASPLNFDPAAPLFPISAPPEYAEELEESLGTFYTTGMVEDHDGLIHGRFDEAAYLAQCEGVLREREKMMTHELKRFGAGFFFCLFDTPDRLQHMFWRFRDKDHPANHGAPVAGMEHVIEDHYRACDAIVGRALRIAGEQTLFIVLSDHGMKSFQRGLNVNTWLYENGWLALCQGVTPGQDAGDFLHGVDWSRTRAYALGLGGIFLNLQGREGQGIVAASEVDGIAAAIAEGLTGLADAQRNMLAVRSVLTREKVYRGPYASESPDLLINFADGYRVSWSTPLGAVPQGIFEDNVKKWGGDHMVDPAIVPGVLFMNRPFAAEGASMTDLAPTILAALGAAKGAAMEGRSLLP